MKCINCKQNERIGELDALCLQCREYQGPPIELTEAMVETIENPKPPTPAMIDLMKKYRSKTMQQAVADIKAKKA